MAKRDIVKNAIWGAIAFMALPVVTALAFVTGEDDKAITLSHDLSLRIEAISDDIYDIKADLASRRSDESEVVYDEAIREEDVDKSEKDKEEEEKKKEDGKDQDTVS